MKYSIRFHWPITIEPSFKKGAIKLSVEGYTLEAVKLIKKSTGWGLKESKDYYDTHIRGYIKK